MRILLFLAIIFFALALISLLVPTLVLGEGWQVWTVGGLFVWALDNLLGAGCCLLLCGE